MSEQDLQPIAGNRTAMPMTGSTRRIVITGVSRGLGRAMLQEFAARGHTVAGCGRPEAAIEKLSLAFPSPHRFATVDVADDRQVGQWARHVLTTIGPPDILIIENYIIS